MTIGSINISGLQTNLAGGGQQSVGPYSVPMSATQDSQSITVNTTATVAVPSTAYGVIVNGPASGTTTIEIKTVSGDTGIFIDPTGLPTVICFDHKTPHVPSNLYLVSGASVVVNVQFF